MLADYGNKPAEEVQQDACKLIIKVAMNLQDKKGKPSDFDAAKAAAIDLATTYLQVRLLPRLRRTTPSQGPAPLPLQTRPVIAPPTHPPSLPHSPTLPPSYVLPTRQALATDPSTLETDDRWATLTELVRSVHNALAPTLKKMMKKDNYSRLDTIRDVLCNEVLKGWVHVLGHHATPHHDTPAHYDTSHHGTTTHHTPHTTMTPPHNTPHTTQHTPRITTHITTPPPTFLHHHTTTPPHNTPPHHNTTPHHHTTTPPGRC